ncbi:MAG: hypothetical protein IAF58_12620, partial [Leptolyngbya sp.]|nr:hypothetical protein [Candidatus Melainabacteria bacterium]
MRRSKRNQKTIKLQTSALLACLVSGAICGAPSFAAESSADPPAAPAFKPITGGTQSATLKTGTDSTTLQTGTQSTTLQTGTQSTTLQTGTQSTTLQTGTGTTTLQTGTGSTLIQSGAQTGLIQGGASREAGPINILFLLDCSFSMKEGMGDKIQKMDAAKTVLQQALARIPS